MAPPKNTADSSGTPAPAPSSSSSTPGPRTIPGLPRAVAQMTPVEESSPQSGSSHSTGTVRRLGEQEAADLATLPSSVDSFNTAQESVHETEVPQPRPSASRQASYSSLRDIVANPTERRQRRPSGSRRNTTVILPQKGQGFSADDEASEVEGDWENKRAFATTGFSTMRRRTSQVLRRRATQPQSVESDQAAVDESMPEVTDDDGDGPPDDGTVRAESYTPSDSGSAESFTLKDRQQAINQTHPFGIRIWKPALYKKNRSVQRTAEGDIHSAPGGSVGSILFFVNVLWVLLFGWWMATAAAIAGIGCGVIFFNESNRQYSRVLFGLANYLLYPFGRFVELKQEDEYAEEDEGEGRSISEYEQWQAGDIEAGRTFFGPHGPRNIVGHRRDSLDTVSESESLLGAGERTGLISGVTERSERKRRLFGRGQWTFGRVMFYAWFYCIIAPILLLVSGICWFLVFWIPMAKVTYILFDHLRRHPLALSFHSDHTWTRRPDTPGSSILLCTYRAVGWKYYKYTVDGTNIFFINLMTIVIFVIVDHFILNETLHLKGPFTSPATIFTLALFSVIPLAYFIGQAVASISAQSSMGVGAAINAFFSTVVEVYLYCIALSEGKGRLVEGSIMGSIFAGVVLMPGLSMCSGALNRKTQRFNAKSAGVTSTMLLFAVIAAFAPTLFYQIYGTYELNCHACVSSPDPADSDCRKCMFSQSPPTANDKFYRTVVQPYTYVAAVFLFISYVVGLFFTLKTHAAIIWQQQPPPPPTHPNEFGRVASRNQDGSAARTPASVRDSQLYKRILGQSLSNIGLRQEPQSYTNPTPHVVPPKSSGNDLRPQSSHGGGAKHTPAALNRLTTEQDNLAHRVIEVAAAVATSVVQDDPNYRGRRTRPQLPSQPTMLEDEIPVGGDAEGAHGGHDAPNWGRVKSSVILLGATVLYAIIAEILVDTVDVVLVNSDIDEKFLGITLFALVPNTTEFLNAISFAMNGNIALSMEIGSAYALQVCLLQIPALVAFSAWYSYKLQPEQFITHSFNMIFPQWDLVAVILCVFLLSNIYAEGKSNYFKGTILILSYLTVMLGFYLASFAQDASDEIQAMIMGVGQKGRVYNMGLYHERMQTQIS